MVCFLVSLVVKKVAVYIEKTSFIRRNFGVRLNKTSKVNFAKDKGNKTSVKRVFYMQVSIIFSILGIFLVYFAEVKNLGKFRLPFLR